MTKKLNKKIQEYSGLASLITLTISIVMSLWIVFGYLTGFKTMLVNVHRNTLKNTITNENLAIEERLAACDVYVASDYNSATRKKCDIIYKNYGGDE